MEEMVEDYPRTLAELESRFSSEQACREYLFRLRWPEGFRCSRCDDGKAWPLRSGLWQCARCGYQISVTAGTIFQDTRTPLTVWFRAMWWVTSQKNGVSALGLQRVLGLGSYQTAWAWLHKLRRAMVRPGRDRLSGKVEVDETYLGGLEEGVRGRQTDSKALIVVAAQKDGQGIGRIRMRRIPNVSAQSLDSLRGRVRRTRPRGPHRRLVGLCSVTEPRVRSQDQFSSGKQAIAFRAVAASSSGGVALKALAAGYASGSGERRASRLLPGRVHLPVQPAQIAQSRKAVFPTVQQAVAVEPTTYRSIIESAKDALVPKPQPIGGT